MSLRHCPTDRRHKVDTSDRHCEECGAKTVQYVCPNGHERYNDKAKFCWSCGVALEPIPQPTDPQPTEAS